MEILQEILKWSSDRPLWQRDALRRLVQSGELQERDLDELTEICKADHGLASKQDAVPLSRRHLPLRRDDHGKVAVQSVHHLCGVNALAADQTLKFGQGLTVVYGDNAAGKSGYTRILKAACRARGAEEILGNVLSGAAPPTLTISIGYSVGVGGAPQEWPGGKEDEALSRVSVFDTYAAAVYLKEKTDVAFRPFGLDLFDKLSRACTSLRLRLEHEQRALQSGGLRQLPVAEGTAVANLISRLSSLTDVETVRALATLTPDELDQTALLEKQLTDLQANDPDRLAQELSLRAGRLQTLKTHLEAIDLGLSAQAMEALAGARETAQTKANTAQQLRSDIFTPDLLCGTGSDEWASLWAAARTYSETGAYPGRPFPVTEGDARCVLCQQDLDADAATRLRRLEEFVVSYKSGL